MCPPVTENDPPTLTAESTFRFACHDALPCFTQCCRDVNIYLTPYDAVRIRKALGMGSEDFLARYTRHFLARRTNIPVVQLAMDPDTLYCRFVTEQGCRIYADRPWACRMFPLDITPVEGEYRTIAGEERCLGLLEAGSRTVKEWLETQGVAHYAEMDLMYQSVVPERFQPGAPMNEGLGRLMFLAYDLDRFAGLIQNPGFRSLYDVDDEMFRQVSGDAEALLKLAYRYIRSQMEELYPVV